MVNYRRNKLDCVEAVYFLTFFTQKRRKRFVRYEDYRLLWDCMESIKQKYNVHFDAWVMMPEHLHWLLRPGNADYSKVVYSFKKKVSSHYKQQGIIVRGEKFWHDRFWEHTIRNEGEFWRTVEYIHFNPVKHGYEDVPSAWKYSSLGKWIKEGVYPSDWTSCGDIAIAGDEWDVL